MFKDLWKPLLLTIAIEYPIIQILWFFIKDKEQKSKLVFWKNRIIIIPALIVNVLTNPAINILYRCMVRYSELEQDTIWTIISVLEVGIFFIEGVLYKFLLKTSWAKGFLISLVSNFTSYMSSFLL
jgi:hypothetical protein